MLHRAAVSRGELSPSCSARSTMSPITYSASVLRPCSTSIHSEGAYCDPDWDHKSRIIFFVSCGMGYPAAVMIRSHSSATYATSVAPDGAAATPSALDRHNTANVEFDTKAAHLPHIADKIASLTRAFIPPETRSSRIARHRVELCPFCSPNSVMAWLAVYGDLMMSPFGASAPWP
jgi:hypothetical protein